MREFGIILIFSRIKMIFKSKINDLCYLLKDLGEEVERIKKTDFSTDLKEDKSPLTEADKFVNHQLTKFFKKNHYENIISEEIKNTPYNTRKDWNDFWVIDPIDGTKEFIKKNDDYTINLALFSKRKLVLGIVYAPATRDLYLGIKGNGAAKNNKIISVRKAVSNKIIVVASKSHINRKTDEYIKKLEEKISVEKVSIGSSLKICLVAEGAADIYPRFGPTMEWDTAAAHIILEEAGGSLVDSNTNKTLLYNKEDLTNPYFIAYGVNKYFD